MKAKRLLDDQRGVALIVALILLLVLTLIGISAISTSTFETSIAGNQRVYNAAFYAADGGVENLRGALSSRQSFVVGTLSSITIGNSGERCEPKVIRKWPRNVGGGVTAYQLESKGIAPNFPVAGTVTIEAIIETPWEHEGY